MLDRVAAGVKWCPRCERWLQLDQFSACPSRGRDGLSALCRACGSAAVTERRTRAKRLSGLADGVVVADSLRVKKKAALGAVPTIPDLPRMDWSRGLCVTAPARIRSWWTSDDHSERQAAARNVRWLPPPRTLRDLVTQPALQR
jgi:hypothetical protein